MTALLTNSAAHAVTKRATVTPFTDNLSINLIHFSETSPLTAFYQSDNDVDIDGPNTISGNQFSTTITSNNKIENGFPRLTLHYATSAGAQTCTLELVDGPWTVLNFRYKNPPKCAGLNISQIIPTTAYQYGLNITMQDS